MTPCLQACGRELGANGRSAARSDRGPIEASKLALFPAKAGVPRESGAFRGRFVVLFSGSGVMVQTHALQANIDATEAGRRLVAGARSRGGAAWPAARLVVLPVGPCGVGVTWAPVAAGGVLISYTLPDGCEPLAEVAEEEIDRVLEARSSGGASWQLPALVAAVVLGAAVVVFAQRGRR